MVLQFRDIPTIISQSAAAAAATCPNLTDLSAGSPFLALLYAVAFNSSYQQWLTALDVAMSRLSTCTGADVDSFVADFGLTRLAATSATGQVTFGRYTATQAVSIPVGTTVKTSDGTVSYIVIVDYLNEAYNGQAYQMGAGTFNVTVPVQAVIAGSGGNVQANTITLISSSLSAANFVNNALAITNGIDPETDAALIARFPKYLRSLSSATGPAIEYAVSSVQQGLTYSIAENVNAAGQPQNGAFTIFVDDGSGNPPSSLLQAVGAAVEAVRPISVTYSILSAIVEQVSVSVTIYAANGYDKPTLQGLASAAIQTYVNGQGVGGTIGFYALSAVITSIEGIARIEGLTLNGTIGQDVGGGSNIVCQAVSVAVN